MAGCDADEQDLLALQFELNLEKVKPRHVMANDSGLRLCAPQNLGCLRADIVMRECCRFLAPLQTQNAEPLANKVEHFPISEFRLSNFSWADSAFIIGRRNCKDETTP